MWSMFLVRTARRFLGGVRHAAPPPATHARAEAARAAAEAFLRERADLARDSLRHRTDRDDIA